MCIVLNYGCMIKDSTIFAYIASCQVLLRFLFLVTCFRAITCRRAFHLLLWFLLRLLLCPIDHWRGGFERLDLSGHVSVFEPWCTWRWNYTCQFSQAVPRIARTLRGVNKVLSATASRLL